MSSSNEDLKAHAALNQDFYGLLDVSPAAAESEIRRAYRRTALKYHPDKVANSTPADVDKFHLLQIAYGVLSDPSVRQLYDNARDARLRTEREREMMGAAKRKMREDLEARERAGAAGAGAGVQRGMKRPWSSTTGVGADMDDGDAEAKLQREIERIAQDGRRRRQEAEERLKREIDEEEKIMQQEEEEARRAADKSSQRVDRSQEGGTNVSELERAVKVRWVRESRGLELDKDKLAALFAPFGKVESVVTLKDKRQRLGDKREKKTVATGVVVFTSIVSAHTAVLDSEKKIRQSVGQADSDWAIIDSVFWASGTQPDLGMGGADTRPASTPPPPPPPAQEKPPTSSKPIFNFPGAKAAMSNGTATKPGKAPSFASFSSAAAAANAPKPSPAEEPSQATNTPSMEELTLMRLKNAQREKERKALEEQLRKEDEAEDAAEAATAGQS